MAKPFWLSVVFSVALFLSLAFLAFISPYSNLHFLYAKLIWFLFISCIGFCVYRSGIISRYRSILFVLVAFFFFLEFKLFRFLSFPTALPPYCHIAQAPTLFNFIHSQFLAITSGSWKVFGFLTFGFLWLLIMFTIGQGICSWVCFYGGIDTFFSKLAKTPFLKLKITLLWRDFPLAFLIFLLIVSFLQGLPVFCSWFCPFKMTEAFWSDQALIKTIQAVFFLVSLVVFLVLLPFLSKKRTFCSFLCPFGALVSVCGKISPYKVNINEQKCTRCGKCLEVCPMLAIEHLELKGFKISSYCNKCGKCIDVCPVGAITILFRDIFIFLALLITGAVSGLFVPQAILRLAGL